MEEFEIIKNHEKLFLSSVDRFAEEAKKIRTGRANPALLENIQVECYGSLAPLKQLASITVVDSKTLIIQPWDRQILSNIEKSLQSSEIGLNPVNDGQILRLIFPPLTEEKRRELVKFLNSKAEEVRIAIRKVRDEAWKMIQEAERDGRISEDGKFKAKDKLQKVVNEYNHKIEEIREKREKEIMAV